MGLPGMFRGYPGRLVTVLGGDWGVAEMRLRNECKNDKVLQESAGC